MPTIVKCPHCKTSVKWIKENEYRPFCSIRCKMIDFGHWDNETYTIPAPPDLEDIDED